MSSVTWRSLPIKKTVKKISTVEKKIKQKETLSEGAFPVIDQGQSFIAGYYNDPSKVVDVGPVIVFGDHTRAIKFVDFPFVPGADGTKVLQPDSELFTPKLFYYFLQCIKFPDKGYARHYQHLEKELINIPPIDQQEKIVTKIEELFSELDSAESALTVVSNYYKSYEQSIIDTLFARYEAEAEMTRFGNIAEIKGGITKGRKIKGTPIGEIPYLRVANVQDGYLYLDEIKTINITADELQKYTLRDGDILFTEGGDKDKLGRGTIWHGEIEPCIHQNHIFRARVDSDKFLPEYISYATKTTRARDYFFSKAKQTTNLASLNMTNLKDLRLPDLAPDLQREIVESISTKLIEMKSVKKELIVSHHRSKTLKQSILAKAFKGELV